MEDYLLVVSLPLTLVILGLSVLYSWGNLSRLWKAGSPSSTKTAIIEKKTIADVTVKASEMENVDNIGEAGDGFNSGYKVDADPYEYCGHIQSEVKKARQRVATRDLQQNLSDDDIEAERLAQKKQLEEIFKLMQQESDKFGMESMEDVNSQMKLYC